MNKKLFKSNKRAEGYIIDMEFLVELIRGLIVLFVIFLIGITIYKIFIYDKDEDLAQKNFLSFVEVLKHLPPGANPIQYAIDLGDAEEFYVIDTKGSPDKQFASVEPPECASEDCLCLCEENREECIEPLICTKVFSELDKQQLSFDQFKKNNFNYVEVFQTEELEEKKTFTKLLLRREGNNILICDANECSTGDCVCFNEYEKSFAKKTAENLGSSVKKCYKSLNAATGSKEEITEKLKENIKDATVQKITPVCSSSIKNVIVDGQKSKEEGWQLIIKNAKMYLRHGKEPKEELIGGLPIGLNCVIFANGEVNTDIEEVIITPSDKTIEIVDLGIGKLCLWKKDVLFE
ncbi:hypothetical protein J4434_00970 [Candidatus Woesearchaeota archaeon]|nr:hypothetical protein [Candidatus Woesearchaeota archaeon]